MVRVLSCCSSQPRTLTMAQLPTSTGGGLDIYRGDLFETMREQMDRTLQQFGQLAGLSIGGGRSGRSGSAEGNILAPADVSEDDNAYRITLDLPGIDPNQVEVNLSGRTLT